MTQIGKSFLNWLLVLVIAISPLQFSMAGGFGQGSHEEHCQMTGQEGASDSLMSLHCQMQQGDDCQQHTICIAHSGFSVLPLPLSAVPTSPAVSRTGYVSLQDDVITQYPSRLIRPPRS